MRKIFAICLNTFREALRQRVLYSVIAFALLIIAVSAFFGAVSIGDQAQVIKNFGLFALSFFGSIIAILSGVTLLNKELKQKTIFNILSKPIERWQFIVGKYLGLSLTVCVLLSLMSIALISFCAIFEGRVDLLMLHAVLFILMEVLIVCALVLFFSSFAVTTTLTGLFALGAYLGGRSINYVSHFFLSQKDLAPALRLAIKSLDFCLPDLSLFSVSDAVVYGFPVQASHFGYALLYCLGYVICLLVLAVLIFEQKEML